MSAKLTAAALLSLYVLLPAASASAQSAGLSANVGVDAIDTSRVKQLGCRLSNSRACSSSGASQRQPSVRPSRVGGGPRPRS